MLYVYKKSWQHDKNNFEIFIIFFSILQSITGSSEKSSDVARSDIPNVTENNVQNQTEGRLNQYLCCV